MSTLQTLLNFLVNNISVILGIGICILLLANTVLRDDIKTIKKESFKLVNLDIDQILKVSFCVKYNTDINLSIFLANITNTLKSSRWSPENKSPDDPELINLQEVLLGFGYHNVIFTSIPEQKHPISTGMNRL